MEYRQAAISIYNQNFREDQFLKATQTKQSLIFCLNRHFKLWVYNKLSRNQPAGVCFLRVAKIETCIYLYSSN